MKLCSFDIFDTALLRKCGEPEAVFWLLSRRLFGSDRAARDAFLLWRLSAEGTARRRTGGESTLAQIYADPALSGFGGCPAEEMMAEELRVEAEMLVANPAVRSLIRRMRSEGWTICFVSDMYIDSSTLAAVLRREGCMEEGERVYVSCERGARKSDGRLFDAVRGELQPSEWRHYGDNRESDVKMARRRGVDARWVDTRFTAVELRQLRAARTIRHDYSLRILAGLQRAARTLCGGDAFSAVAADFVAPAYVPYMRFLMRQARDRGLRRLYFLSRDSHVLMRIAEELSAGYPELELRYLFVSRKALLLPYLAGDPSAARLLSVKDGGTLRRSSVASLLADLATDRNEMRRLGIEFAYERIATKEQETDFLNKIFVGAYLPLLKERAAERRRMVLDYFRQEGLSDGVPSGMVDVGWLGTTRLIVSDLLRNEGVRPVEFYYFGIRADALPPAAGVYLSYYRPDQISTELTAMVENYFSASPYPSTIGYRQAAGSVEPVFAPGEAFAETPITRANEAVARWVARELAGIADVSEEAFWEWSRVATGVISDLPCGFDLTPFRQSARFDGVDFVRRLSPVELLRLVAFGKPVTAYDRASLRLTVGPLIDKVLWRVRCLTGRLRRRIYLKTKR